ncbi:hypothetical protein GPL15_21255 [Clostridium sp. MCC353]|uniref:hypothetical protein n=1 Tax=Clostridium sp. MCC353 TaxID=2592646 RepID=UPI001C00D04E|nr:hypothetical protein [Clostridium sp. MCC353]MBT9779009.1 hypothetical protein [Clostridium sp. MCC353]
MNASHILDALEMIDDKYILQAGEHSFTTNPSGRNGERKAGNLRRIMVLIAAAALLLMLCGFGAYKLGLFDYWIQTPSATPEDTVRYAIENQIKKDYTVRVTVDTVHVDTDETKRLAAMYSGSELAEERGWTEEYLAEHFTAVKAVYYIEYDHTKVFMNDGWTKQYFYLVREPETGEWTIIDNTSPDT